MNTYKKLLDNSIIFTIGNLGSKFISFILVPLYTYYLSKVEYGSIDLVMTLVSMGLPLVTLCMHEGIMRFAIDESKDLRKTVTNAFMIYGLGYLVFLLLYPVLKRINTLDSFLRYLYILILVQGIQIILAQLVRGMGESRVYAFNGILLSLSKGALSVLLIVVLKLGVDGFFIADILANLISIIYLVVKLNLLKYFSFTKHDRLYAKGMLQYSVPLIPNQLMWWLINASSRVFIRQNLGLEANGLFAVSSKIPSFLTVFTGVFNQAWQISAIEEFDSDEREEFYSKVFTIYSSALFLLSSGVLLILKPIFKYIFEISYYNAWEPVPFLLLGAVMSALSGFIGQIYLASMETGGIFRTSAYSGIASIVGNFFLIPRFGLIGAGVSSLLSFTLMFLIRYKDIYTKIKINLDVKSWLANFFIYALSTIILFLGLNGIMEALLIIALIIIQLVVNKASVRLLFKAGQELFKKS